MCIPWDDALSFFHTHLPPLMDTTEPPAISIADPPFNDPSNFADLVIRTADNVDFFVVKVLLSLKSPSSFFRNVLEASHHTEERDGLPVLEVKEDSSTFRTVLFFCYPYSIPKITTVGQFMKVGMVLDKYCIDNAFERFVRAVLASSMIKEQSLQVFSVAAANGWKKLGEKAARNSLAVPLEPEVEHEEFKYMNALQYLRLRAYRRNCTKAVQGMNVRGTSKFTGILWLERYSEPLLQQGLLIRSYGRPVACPWCQQEGPCLIETKPRTVYSVHGWLDDYLDLVCTQVSQRPWPDIALDEGIIQNAIVESIAECRDQEWAKVAAHHVRLLGKMLAQEIERRISEIHHVVIFQVFLLNS